MQPSANKNRPYLNKYNITLCTLDEGITYLFINIVELAIWIYDKPGAKELKNVRTRILRVRKAKENDKNCRCCIIVGSVKYEVNLVKS